jgi:hypothetical protein
MSTTQGLRNICQMLPLKSQHTVHVSSIQVQVLVKDWIDQLRLENRETCCYHLVRVVVNSTQ